MKQLGFLTLLIAAMLVLAIAFPVAAAGPKTAPAPVVAAAPAAAVAPVPPPHPRVHEAIEALRSAREHMSHAEGEFHGHRDAAIHHIDEAIKEAEICEREP
jgi:hypothetical protein